MRGDPRGGLVPDAGIERIAAGEHLLPETVLGFGRRESRFREEEEMS